MKKQIPLILFFIIVFSISVSAGTNLFYEDFETGTLANWNAVAWNISSDLKIGVYSAKCEAQNNCNMNTSASIDTSSASQVNVTFWFNDDDLDSLDIIVYWKDNAGNWDFIAEINTATEDTWLSITNISTDAQYFHSGFAILFFGDPDANENIWIDNINVSIISASDTTKPSVLQQYPTNNSINNTGIVNFNCSATDNSNLKNISLWANFTGTWQQNATCNVTGTIGSCQWNKTLPSNTYIWGCLAFDLANNSNWTRNNWTLIVDAIAPNVSLVSPANGTSSALTSYTFNASGTDQNLSNATFYWNYTGVWLPNGTIIMGGTSNSTNFTRDNLAIGFYIWNVQFCDGMGRCNFSLNNFTLNITPPPPPQSFCNGNYTQGQVSWNITSNVTCANQTIYVAGNITIFNNGSLTLYNVTINFSAFADGSNFINKSPNGGLFIYDLDNNPATQEDATEIISNNSNFEYNFWVFGMGGNDNFTMQNSVVKDAGYGSKSMGIYIYNISNVIIYGNNITEGAKNGLRFEFSPRNNISNNFINITATASNNMMFDAFSGSSIIENNTLITSNLNSYGIFTSFNSSTIRNNIIISSGSVGHAIFLSSASNSTLTGNIITATSSGRGIYAYLNSDSNKIQNNNITTATGHGINVENSNFNNITENNITTSGTNSYGIYLLSSSNNTATNNTITTSGSSSYGIYLVSSSNSNTLQSNIITTNGTFGYGIFLSLSLNNSITGNTITTNRDDSYGIYLSRSSNSTLQSNTITTSNTRGYGIYLWINTFTNILSNNTITTNGSNGHGIFLRASSNSNTLSNNTITTNGSSSYGVYIYDNSDSNTLQSNTITTNSTGIYSDTSKLNIISNNTVKNNGAYGIYLTSSNNNAIYNNLIVNNSDGIYLTASSFNNITSNNISSNRGKGINDPQLYNNFGLTAYNNYIDLHTERKAWRIYNNMIQMATPPDKDDIAILEDGFKAKISGSWSTYKVNDLNWSRTYYNDSNTSWVYGFAYGYYLGNPYFTFEINYSITNESTMVNKLIKATNLDVPAGFLNDVKYYSSHRNISYIFDYFINNATQASLLENNYTFSQNNMSRTFLIYDKNVYIKYNWSSTYYYGSEKPMNFNVYIYNESYNTTETFWNETNQSYYNVSRTDIYSTVELELLLEKVNKGEYISTNLQWDDPTKSNNNTIEHNMIQYNADDGIYSDGNYNIIRNNSILTSANLINGIEIVSGNYSTIESNNITTTGSSANGIYLSRSSNSTLQNNTITTSGSSGYGIFILTSSSSNTIQSNNVITRGNGGYGVVVTSNSNLNNLSNNNITTNGGCVIGIDCSYGIYLSSVSNSTIQNNSITTSITDSYGIYAGASNLNIFTGNTINTNSTGIFISSLSNNNTIIGGIIKNGFVGINASQSIGINVINATILNSALWDFYITNNSWVTSLNNSFNKSKVNITYEIGDYSNFTVMWFVNVSINPQNSTFNFTNINLSITTANQPSDVLIIATEYIQNATSFYTYEYNFSAFADGYDTNQVDRKYINSTQVISITLTSQVISAVKGGILKILIGFNNLIDLNNIQNLTVVRGYENKANIRK